MPNGLGKGLNCWESMFVIWGTSFEGLTRTAEHLTEKKNPIT